jgi:poly(hydroxyalkanoate) depolymerase family esterase
MMVTSSTGQFLQREITTDQGVRRYKLFVPGSYNGSKALPLVVMLHGCTQDPDDVARGTQLNAVAEEKSVLVVYPEQPATANPKKCWNWYDPAHQKRDAGEPGLIARITRQVMSDYKVDPSRVYVAGLSAGGAMSAIVAFSYPDLYAAMGSHSGVPYAAASNVVEALAVMQGNMADGAALGALAKTAMGSMARPIPSIVFQGESDAVVNPKNAVKLVAQLAEARGEPIDEKSPTNKVESGETSEGYHYFRSTFGNQDKTIEFWLVKELGHAWSGGSPEGTFTDAKGPKASVETMRFFLEHPRAGATATK